jgi:hypothetical protein
MRYALAQGPSGQKKSRCVCGGTLVGATGITRNERIGYKRI